MGERPGREREPWCGLLSGMAAALLLVVPLVLAGCGSGDSASRRLAQGAGRHGNIPVSTAPAPSSDAALTPVGVLANADITQREVRLSLLYSDRFDATDRLGDARWKDRGSGTSGGGGFAPVSSAVMGFRGASLDPMPTFRLAPRGTVAINYVVRPACRTSRGLLGSRSVFSVVINRHRTIVPISARGWSLIRSAIARVCRS